MKLAIIITLFFSSDLSDSLNYQLEQLQTDSDLATYIEKKSNDIYSYHEKISFISQSLNVAEKRNFQLSEAKANYLLGVSFWAHAKYADASYHLTKALNKYKSLKLINQQAECFNTLGLIQFYIADYSGAITYLDSALHGFQNQQDSSNISRVLNNLGLVYQKIGEYEKSITCIVDAISYKVGYISLVDQSNSSVHNSELHNNTNVVSPLISETLSEMVKAKQENNFKKYASSIADLGTLYQLIEKHDSAFYFLNRAAEVYDSIGQTSNYLLNMLDIADGYADLGNLVKASEIYQALLQKMEEERMIAVIGNVLEKLAKIDISNEQYQSAGEWYKKAIELNDSVGHTASVAKMKLGLATSYLALGENQLALECSLEAKKIAEQINSFSITKESARLLAEVYTKMKDYKRAMTFQSIYFKMALIQKNSEATRIAKELEAKYELQKKVKEINKLDLEVQEKNKFISQQTKYILALIIGVGLLATLFIILFQRGKEVRKLNALIAKRNEEYEILLKEVHHRVKNNLQMITSLLNMQQRRLESNSAKDALSLTKNRVKSIGLIHEHLYKNEDFSQIDLYEYVWELTYMIVNSSITNRKYPKPKIEFDILKRKADIETAMSIGIILNELITNSIKYAFSKNKDPALHVSIHEKSGELEIRVTDNGKGIDENRNDSGFGHTIINTLVQNLNGTVHNTITEEGYEIFIVLKEYNLF